MFANFLKVGSELHSADTKIGQTEVIVGFLWFVRKEGN